MAESLIYNGADITGSVKVIAATLDQYIGTERSDTLELTFGEEDDWGAWKPKTDDVIRYKIDGADSGTMYLYDASIESGMTVLYATATPSSMKQEKTKAWERVYLSQIGAEIAARSGMTFELEGLSDQYYGYMKQEKQTDTAFLSRLAMLEGAALVVYNGRIILAKESALEASDPAAEISTDGAYYDYFDKSGAAYGSAVVCAGQYKGVYIADKENARQYTPPDGAVQASSNAECMRYAAGVLRNANKGLTGFTIRTSMLPSLAAGITCKLAGNIPSGWSGTLFAHHVRHETHKDRTTIFLRKGLEGY